MQTTTLYIESATIMPLANEDDDPRDYGGMDWQLAGAGYVVVVVAC